LPLLAVDMSDGVCLWDLDSGRELIHLALRNCGGAAFEHGGGALLTNSQQGVFRWALRSGQNTMGHLQIGPPERLPLQGNDKMIAQSNDDRVLAIPAGNGAVVLHRGRPEQRIRLGPHTDVRYVAVSPNGQWVVTGSHSADGVKVWEAATGRLVHSWPELRPETFAHFSPDGCQLACLGQLWEVGTWKPGPKIGGLPIRAFSPDGGLLAVLDLNGTIRLLDTATGDERARLEDPYQDHPRWLAFTHDGTRLVTSSDDSKAVRVWDLALIRRQLRDLALDWEGPPYPSAPAVGEEMARAPLRVQVNFGDIEDDFVLGDPTPPEQLANIIVANTFSLAFEPLNYKAYRQRGRAFGRSQEARAAIADYSMALALMPAGDLNRVDLLSRRAGNYLALQEYDLALADIRQAEQLDPGRGPHIRSTHASVLAERAGLLLKTPKGPDDVQEALRHARRAVELAADEALPLRLLGIALYRNEQAREAVPILEKSLAAGMGQWDAADLFFLAMCHAKLGEKEKARECQDRAVRWRQEHERSFSAKEREELNAFQAEAAALLPGP
jgi:tetratricopeptide (TPR) repeat protein